MKKQHCFLTFALALASQFLPGTTPVAEAGVLVNFTLSLNSTIDRGLSYNSFHASGAGTASEFAIGFQIKINSVDGTSVAMSPIASFCSEIQEPISTSTYSFEAKPLNALAAGQAGVSGTASAGIPTGGIGTLRAARLAFLFDQYYISDALTAWTQTNANPTLHAFQLAVWELTHDTDMNITATSGQIYVGAQTGGTNTTRRTNALTLSQTYLNAVAAANVTESYVSTKFDFWALTSASGNGANGNPGFQDVILATEKGSVVSTTLTPILPPLPIPEPGTIPMILFGIALQMGVHRFRTRHA